MTLYGSELCVYCVLFFSYKEIGSGFFSQVAAGAVGSKGEDTRKLDRGLSI